MLAITEINDIELCMDANLSKKYILTVQNALLQPGGI